MKYCFFAKTVWDLFENGYKKQLKIILGEGRTKKILKLAKPKYREIIESIDELDGSQFTFKIFSSAALVSILLNMSKYDPSKISELYCSVMNNKFMHKAAKFANAYTQKKRELLKSQAKKSEMNSNPYSFLYEVKDDENFRKYSIIVKSCGVCHLMKKYNLEEYTQAVCAFDFLFAKMSDTDLTRNCSLADGDLYCDYNFNYMGKLKDRKIKKLEAIKNTNDN